MTNNYRFLPVLLYTSSIVAARALATTSLSKSSPLSDFIPVSGVICLKNWSIEYSSSENCEFLFKTTLYKSIFFIYSFTFKTKGFPKTKYRFITITNKIIYKKPLLASIFSFIFKKAPSNEITTKHTKSKYTL